MTELERQLAALAAEVDWPETPPLTLRAVARQGSRRRLVVAFGLAVVLAVGAVFAVPSARSAILRLFGFGGVTIERVVALPPAKERPLAAMLGRRVTPEAAAAILGSPMRLPRSQGTLELSVDGTVVSALFLAPEPVLLSEFRSGGGSDLLKKLVGDSTGVRALQVGPDAPGVWISGSEHLFINPPAPPRLAGNVLLWQRGEITYRLEGRALDERLALRLAREIDR